MTTYLAALYEGHRALGARADHWHMHEHSRTTRARLGAPRRWQDPSQQVPLAIGLPPQSRVGYAQAYQFHFHLTRCTTPSQLLLTYPSRGIYACLIPRCLLGTCTCCEFANYASRSLQLAAAVLLGRVWVCWHRRKLPPALARSPPCPPRFPACTADGRGSQRQVTK